jgi:hypothetical protein
MKSLSSPARSKETPVFVHHFGLVAVSVSVNKSFRIDIRREIGKVVGDF